MLIKRTSIRLKSLLRFYTVLLCVMAYFYEPYITADMYRIFETMKWYASMDFRVFLHELVLGSSVPAARILFWLVGRTGDNHLLPALSAFICYTLLFYTVRKTQEKYRISRSNTVVALVILMSTSIYISVIGGVRMMLAMALIVFCFFRETVEKKFNLLHLLLYAIAICMHNMAFPILGIRLCVVLMDKRRKRSRRLLLWALILLGCAILMGKWNWFVIQILQKAKTYLTEKSYSDVWEYLMGVILMMGAIRLRSRFRACRGQQRYPELNDYDAAMKLSIVGSAALCFVFSIFYRLIGHLTPILGVPILMVTLQEYENDQQTVFRRTSVQFPVLLYGLLLLALSCARGSLSSLKFFVL